MKLHWNVIQKNEIWAFAIHYSLKQHCSGWVKKKKSIVPFANENSLLAFDNTTFDKVEHFRYSTYVYKIQLFHMWT